MSRIYQKSLLIACVMSIVTLSTVLISQYGFNLNPCVLCVYQRWPYVAVILLVVISYGLRNRVSTSIFEILCALAFAITAGIAAYHVGIEQHWWQGTSACTADVAKVTSLSALKAQIMAAPITKCDEVAWQMFGISMAGFNFIFAAIMSIFMMVSVVWRRLEMTDKQE